MKFKVQMKPAPLKCWQTPWGFRRLTWVGADRTHPTRGWQLGLGLIGFEVWL